MSMLFDLCDMSMLFESCDRVCCFFAEKWLTECSFVRSFKLVLKYSRTYSFVTASVDCRFYSGREHGSRPFEVNVERVGPRRVTDASTSAKNFRKTMDVQSILLVITVEV